MVVNAHRVCINNFGNCTDNVTTGPDFGEHIFMSNLDFLTVTGKCFNCDVLFHCLFLYREPARAVVFYLEPDTKVQQFFILPNIFSIFFRFFAKICGFCARFRPEPGIFAYDNPKIQSLCPLNVCRAATNGANPAKSIQPKNRPNAKAAPHTRPGIVKSPRKAKRNREPPEYPGNSLSLPCLFTHVSPHTVF